MRENPLLGILKHFTLNVCDVYFLCYLPCLHILHIKATFCPPKDTKTSMHFCSAVLFIFVCQQHSVCAHLNPVPHSFGQDWHWLPSPIDRFCVLCYRFYTPPQRSLCFRSGRFSGSLAEYEHLGSFPYFRDRINTVCWTCSRCTKAPIMRGSALALGNIQQRLSACE